MSIMLLLVHCLFPNIANRYTCMMSACIALRQAAMETMIDEECIIDSDDEGALSARGLPRGASKGQLYSL